MLKRRLSSRELRLSRPPPVRDMEASPFNAILADLVRRIPGAYASVLVDYEGESVDYAGVADPFDLKVAAAHWRIVVNQIIADAHITDLKSIVVRGVQRSYIVHTLPDGYALVMVLRKRAGFVPFARPVSSCIRLLAREAQWPIPEKPHGEASRTWWAVRVDTDRKHRPERVFGEVGGFALEVLGAVVGLRRREKGFRVRLETGKELTLVREPSATKEQIGGFWYADDEPR